MIEGVDKKFYLILGIHSGKLTIIDAMGKNIIKEVDVSVGSNTIFIDLNDNVYIMNGKNIAVIDRNYNLSKIRNIPCNGNMQIDETEKKMYVSDTDEVNIYDLVKGEKIHVIKGFIAADRMHFNKNKTKLFVLDVLAKEIKSYDTLNLELVDVYKNIGAAPCDISLGESDNYIYIANKEAKNGDYPCTINLLDTTTKEMTKIDMPIGSNISILEQAAYHLYAANTGLNQIEVIDVQKNCIELGISPSLQILKRIHISKDKDLLFIISRNRDGFGAIDVIDTSSLAVRDTLMYEAATVLDAEIVTVSEIQNGKENLVFMKL